MKQQLTLRLLRHQMDVGKGRAFRSLAVAEIAAELSIDEHAVIVRQPK